MKPIDSLTLRNGYSRVVFAKDQLQYLQLPAQKSKDGMVITEWKLSIWERLKIVLGFHLHLKMLTFNKPLQPIKLSIGMEDK